MINIRYRDPNELSPGLHAEAERSGRTTTVYLLSGLSTAQRRAALRRLRIAAGRGYGPRLPAPQLAVALAADRVRTTLGHAGAVFRSHPAGSTVPVMVLSAGAIAFLALSAVSIQVVHRPLAAAPPSIAGAAAPDGDASVSVGPRHTPGPAPAALAGRPGSGRPESAPAVSGNGSHAGNTTTGGAQPTPTPGGDPTTAPATGAPTISAPTQTATVAEYSATPAGGRTKTCIELGPLGVCL